MKLITFQRRSGGGEEVGVLRADGTVLPVAEAGLDYRDMNALIRGMTAEEKQALETCDAAALPAGEVRILAPIPRPLQDVICLGLNYTEHAREAASFSEEAFTAPPAAVYFSKRVNYAPGPEEEIPAHQDLTSQLDYECELAVIIGKDAVKVTPEDAAEYIFGYTICNDVSARELQTGHKQWLFGKSLDGFCPMGPCIVTADEIAYPPELRIYTTVNGELRQDSRTSYLLHGISEIIHELSCGMTLQAGTVIATGTPKGVAMGMEPPRFLKPGDRVVCGIEGIGELANTVR
ncbi:MAG: fumarylacetoacetate hydrolase family protein [Lachnospiraceae bacterium]|nr:fumarylacetoacetate hydrolase family protein [Lachnospiraceae bacterium]